jgi:hypothetical protein
MTGILAPVLVMSLAMGIEVTSWSLTKVELQRVADVAAWAGTAQYVAAINANNTAIVAAQSATKTAADLAEINGASGTSTRTWNATTLTTTDNVITAQIVNGVKNTSDTAVKVTITRSIAKSFSNIFPSTKSSVTVSATAISEIVSSAPSSPQPCLVALQTGGSGVTDVTLTGSAGITAAGCSVRSNAGITLTGSTTLNVGGTYAAGSITTCGENVNDPGDCSSTISGGRYPNSGTITDPYASNASLKTAFSELASGTTPGPTYADPNTSWMTQTISPGTYPSLTLGGSSTVTLSPGTYYVKGNVNFNGNATITGTNVTIISSGTLTDTNSAHVTLTAPTPASGDGVPGILFASQSTSQSQFGGSVTIPLTGVIYYPNGSFAFNGSASAGASGCGEVIAGTITITGAATLSSTNCGTYGTANFGSLPSTSSVALVQ